MNRRQCSGAVAGVVGSDAPPACTGEPDDAEGQGCALAPFAPKALAVLTLQQPGERLAAEGLEPEPEQPASDARDDVARAEHARPSPKRFIVSTLTYAGTFGLWFELVDRAEPGC